MPAIAFKTVMPPSVVAPEQVIVENPRRLAPIAAQPLKPSLNCRSPTRGIHMATTTVVTLNITDVSSTVIDGSYNLHSADVVWRKDGVVGCVQIVRRCWAMSYAVQVHNTIGGWGTTTSVRYREYTLLFMFDSRCLFLLKLNIRSKLYIALYIRWASQVNTNIRS